jgi:hypothetical protein
MTARKMFHLTHAPYFTSEYASSAGSKVRPKANEPLSTQTAELTWEG